MARVVWAQLKVASEGAWGDLKTRPSALSRKLDASDEKDKMKVYAATEDYLELGARLVCLAQNSRSESQQILETCGCFVLPSEEWHEIMEPDNDIGRRFMFECGA